MNYFYLVPFLFMVLTGFFAARVLKKNTKRNINKKKVFFLQIASCLFVSVMFFGVFSNLTKAAPETTGLRNNVSDSVASSRAIAYGLGLIAAAIALGTAAIGGGVAIAAGLPAAIAAITEDPNISGKIFLFVVMGEAIAIYGVVVAFTILSKLDILLV